MGDEVIKFRKVKVGVGGMRPTEPFWLTQFRFYVPLNTKEVISEMFLLVSANLLAWY